jgi:hypothetical protein
MVSFPMGVVSCNFEGSVTFVGWNDPFMMEVTNAEMPGDWTATGVPVVAAVALAGMVGPALLSAVAVVGVALPADDAAAVWLKL